MFADPISVNSPTSGTWGELPEQVSNAVSLARVNNDNFQSSYRFTGTDGRYTVNIRNSVESPKAGRSGYDRHQLQIIYERFATADGTVTAATFDCYAILRVPQGIPPGDIKPFVYALATRLSTEAFVDKLINGES